MSRCVLTVEEYSELSPQAEADLENLLLRDNAIQDAAAFMEHLSEELAQLDQGNIHSLMGSEVQITQLLEHLDQAVMEIEKMETRLDVYDTLLSNVRDNMGKLGSQYAVILLQNTNLKALCKEVDDLVVRHAVCCCIQAVVLVAFLFAFRANWTLTLAWRASCVTLHSPPSATSGTVRPRQTRYRRLWTKSSLLAYPSYRQSRSKRSFSPNSRLRLDVDFMSTSLQDLSRMSVV